MSGMTVDFDPGNVLAKVSDVVGKAPIAANHGVEEVAREVLRLSQKEVPHDEGTLQNSGNVQVNGSTALLGYHTAYAAYQHEGQRGDGSRPISNYGKGRKGKYVEDPITQNADNLLLTFARRAEGDLSR